MQSLISPERIEQAGVDLCLSFSSHLAELRNEMDPKTVAADKISVNEKGAELDRFLLPPVPISTEPLVSFDQLLTSDVDQKSWSSLVQHARGDFDSLLQLSDDLIMVTKLRQLGLYLRLAPEHAYLFGDLNKASELLKLARAKALNLFGESHSIVRQIDAELLYYK